METQVLDATDALTVETVEAADRPANGKFNGVYARDMARKAAMARHLAAQRRREVPVNPDEPLPTKTKTGGPDWFRTLRLVRVRRQLDLLDSMIMKESDPQKLDRLASAQSKLSVQERELAGRPVPGALRPTSRRSRNQGGGFSPAE